MVDDDEKYIDLKETDISPEKLAEIEEVQERLRKLMESGDPFFAWKMALPSAVLFPIDPELHPLDDEVLKHGQAVSLYLASDDLQLQKENIHNLDTQGWEKLEAAVQSYLTDNPEVNLANLNDLRTATLVACFAMADSNDRPQ